MIAKKPRWVSILAGTNDVPEPTPLASYKANIKSMVDAAINAGIGVFLCLMPPRSDSATNALRCAAWSDWLRAYAVTKPEVILIDLHTSLADSAGMWKTEYLKDGIHPNAAGALQMATVFGTPSPRTSSPRPYCPRLASITHSVRP